MNILVLFGHGNKPGLLRMLNSIEKGLKSREYQFYHAIDLKNESFKKYGFDEESCVRVKKVKKIEGFPGSLFQHRDHTKLLSFCREKRINLILSYTLSTLPAAIALAKKSGIPSAVWLHNDYPDSAKRYGKYKLRHCDAIITVSDFVMRGVREHLGATEKKLFVVYNAIDVDGFRSQADSQPLPAGLPESKSNAVVVGMIAVMDKNKNPQLLLKAVAKIKENFPDKGIKVLFAGRFPDKVYEEETVKLAEKLGIKQKVSFLGFQSNVSAICRYADILVYPSYREAFSLSSVEAMAWAKPVIASRTGGIPEVVEDGVTGILCKPGDVDQFARALSRLVEDSDLRSEMGKSGRERAKKIFSIARLAEDVANITKLTAR